MKIGYGKIGRSWKLDPTKGTVTGGDADVARGLHMLSRMRPNDEIILVSNNTGEDPATAGYPSNVVNPWGFLRQEIKTARIGSDEQKVTDFLQEITAPLFTDLDAMVIWAGQHGTSNMPIPTIEDRSVVTKPQISFVNYGSYLLNGINAWRDQNPAFHEEMWLCPDPRNYLKCRDLKWPLKQSIIAQYEYEREAKHERFGDNTPPELWGCKWDPKAGEGVWVAGSRYTYEALELTALPSPARVLEMPTPGHDERYDFGMIVNENRAYVSKDRVSALQEWVLPSWPNAEIFGTWSDKSKETLGRPDIRPCPYQYLRQVMQRWRCTLTTPASGSGWATAKPWECFAHGTICFFHPHYDDQDHILKDAPKELHELLRVKTPEELRARVDWLGQHPADWRAYIDIQRKYYVEKYNQHTGGMRAVLERLPQ